MAVKTLWWLSIIYKTSGHQTMQSTEQCMHASMNQSVKLTELMKNACVLLELIHINCVKIFNYVVCTAHGNQYLGQWIVLFLDYKKPWYFKVEALKELSQLGVWVAFYGHKYMLSHRLMSFFWTPKFFSCTHFLPNCIFMHIQ